MQASRVHQAKPLLWCCLIPLPWPLELPCCGRKACHCLISLPWPLALPRCGREACSCARFAQWQATELVRCCRTAREFGWPAGLRRLPIHATRCRGAEPRTVTCKRPVVRARLLEGPEQLRVRQPHSHPAPAAAPASLELPQLVAAAARSACLSCSHPHPLVRSLCLQDRPNTCA